MDTAAASLFFKVAAFALALAVLLFYLGMKLFRQQAQAYQEQCRQLRDEIELMETERNRIARDLHDELGSYLYMIKAQVGAMEGAHEEDRALAAKAALHINHVIERMNGITRNMSPHVLQEFGLQEALTQYLIHMQESGTTLLRLQYCCPVALRPESSLHLYRMAQELVANASKHAGATLVQLRLNQRNGQLILDCRDNGRGFSETGSKGLGMHSLRRRAALLGGQVALLQSEETGTHIAITLPLKQVSNDAQH